MKILWQGLSKAIVSRTKSGSHKMVYWHFEVMKLASGSSLNVEPVSFGIGCKLEDFVSPIKGWCCWFFLFHGWSVISTLYASGKLLQAKYSPS